MNHEEQTLIDGLFARLRQAEAEGAPRDAQAQAHIAGLVQQHAVAPYYMAQAILVQEAAIKRLDEQNRQLQTELAAAKAQAAAAASAPAQQSSGGFLSSIFGSGTRPAPSQPAAAPAPSSGGGWRDGPGSAPQSNWGAPPAPAPQAAPARSGASSFLGGALQTAAGVAGGVMLAQGISSLFHHNSQPEEIVEVIKEEPAPTSDHGGWNDDNQRYTADNGNDAGFTDTGYNDDGGGFFSDDDYV